MTVKLTRAQTDLLRVLARSPFPRSVSDLGHDLGITRNAAFETIQRLRKKGLTATYGRRGIAPGWIPVAAELPDVSTEVLVFWSGTDAPETFELAVCDLTTWRSKNDGEAYEVAPTHWTPLPQPPK